MIPHPRWPGVAASVLVALAWLLSLPFNSTISPWGHTINLCNGGVDFVVNTAVPARDWSVEVNSPREPMRWWFGFRVYAWSPAHIAWRIPLWSVLLITMGVTWAAFRSHLRRSRSAAVGRCRRCGYDLAGSPPGPCPECGRAATDARA